MDQGESFRVRKYLLPDLQELTAYCRTAIDAGKHLLIHKQQKSNRFYILVSILCAAQCRCWGFSSALVTLNYLGKWSYKRKLILLPSFTRQQNSILQQHRSSLRHHLHTYTWLRWGVSNKPFPSSPSPPGFCQLLTLAGKLMAPGWAPCARSEPQLCQKCRQRVKWAKSAKSSYWSSTPHPQLALPGTCSKTDTNVIKKHSHSTAARTICYYFNICANRVAEGHSQGRENFRA